MRKSVLDLATSDDVELWFLRRGVPMLVPHDAASHRSGRSERVWRRALPALVVIYLAVLVGCLTFGARWGVLVSALVFMGSWMLGNLVRGAGPLSLPESLGNMELVAFVVGPAAAVLFVPNALDLFGIEIGGAAGRVFAAFGVALLQVLTLGAVWVAVAFGVVAMTAWLLREFAKSLSETGATLARTLPLLLGVVTFFFFTGELWQSIGRLRGLSYGLVVLLFVLLGGGFIARGRNLDLDTLSRFETADDLRESLVRCELASHSFHDAGAHDFPLVSVLGKRERVNLLTVAVLSRLVVALVVGVVTGFFFVVLGLIAIDEEVVRAWAAHDPRVIARFNLPPRTVVLSWELLNVAGFLATFSGFYFTIVSATDPSLRMGLRDTAEEAIRDACAARLVLTSPSS